MKAPSGIESAISTPEIIVGTAVLAIGVVIAYKAFQNLTGFNKTKI